MDPKHVPPHLRGLSGGQRERLTPELNLELADLHTASERRARERAAALRNGTLAVPDFLSDLPRPTALLYLALPDTFDAEHAEEIGGWFGLDAAGATDALATLQRGELARPLPEEPGRFTRLPPGDRPF